MRSHRIGCGLFILLVVSSSAFATDIPRTPADVPGFSAVVATPDVKVPLTNAQLGLCIKETARIMKVDEQNLPQIIVLQLSPAEAKRLGLDHIVLLANKGKSPGTFYEVWLVGPQALNDMVRGVAMVFELYYGLGYSDEERRKVVKRISGVMNATVSIDALRGTQNENSADR